MKTYVVSGCLAGLSCRYDGGSKPFEPVRRLVEEGRAVTACPESLSGLPVPRPPCEQRDGRVIMRTGEDVTEAFELGAERAMRIVRAHGCTAAILKARSPSCGFGQIYDGSFTGATCAGMGIWASRLREAGLTLYSEDMLPPELTGETD